MLDDRDLRPDVDKNTSQQPTHHSDEPWDFIKFAIFWCVPVFLLLTFLSGNWDRLF